MDTIKKLLLEIQVLDADAIRARLAALALEEKELRKVLRLRLDLARERGKEAAPCRK